MIAFSIDLPYKKNFEIHVKQDKSGGGTFKMGYE